MGTYNFCLDFSFFFSKYASYSNKNYYRSLQPLPGW